MIYRMMDGITKGWKDKVTDLHTIKYINRQTDNPTNTQPYIETDSIV